MIERMIPRKQFEELFAPIEHVVFEQPMHVETRERFSWIQEDAEADLTNSFHKDRFH